MKAKKNKVLFNNHGFASDDGEGDSIPFRTPASADVVRVANAIAISLRSMIA